jgi:hypothetical protein
VYLTPPQRPVRASLAVILAAGILIGAAPAAWAGDIGGISTSCTNTTATCTVSAQDPGSGTGVGGSSSHTVSKTSGGPPPLVSCTDTPFVITPQNAAVLKVAQYTDAGHWVVRSCSGKVLPPTRILTWIPDGAATPDPRVLAAQAQSRLTLPTPVIESSPGDGAPQTVQLPTWAWLLKTQWTMRSATASVPGESVTATAVPLSVTWTWGDGVTTICQGPGTPYVDGVNDPVSASPDCGHTYRQTSATAPGQQFTVTATLTWAVAWRGAGRSGTLPNLTTAATVRWTVRQIESLIVNR